ncbi:WD40 repeat domain-containing protein [Sorangium sp. So ce295]|uniref:WD40 repeat domain-containing protein n=1 Tax=Sorangium sp. So ce295 TaxID=3133295 RepID=UPI003F6471C1
MIPFSELHARLEVEGPHALTEDSSLSATAATRLVMDAIRLSAHVLAGDPGALAAQLRGRLLGCPLPEVEALLEQATQAAKSPQLLPMTRNLTPPGGPLLRTLTGHSGAVHSVALTPDGRRIVSGSSDHTVKVWDLASGAEIMTLTGHGDAVKAVAVTPDGLGVLSGSTDGTLTLWDLQSGAERWAFPGLCPVEAVAVTPDGERALIAQEDEILKVVRLRDGVEEHALEGHVKAEENAWFPNVTRAVAITPDGQRAVSASEDRSLILWDLARGTAVRALWGHTSWVTAVAITPGGARAISGGGDGLKVWELATGEIACDFPSDGRRINDLAVMPDERHVISAGFDFGEDGGDWLFRIIRLADGSEVRALDGHADEINGVAISPDGQRVVSASGDGTLKIWDLSRDGHPVEDLLRGARRGHTRAVSAIAVLPGGQRAISASIDHTIKRWDLQSCREERAMRHEPALPTWNMSEFDSALLVIDRDGKRMFSAIEGPSLTAWDIASGERLWHAEGSEFVVARLAITPDGSKLIVQHAHEDHIRVLDSGEGEQLRALGPTWGQAGTMVVTPDGRRLVVASWHTIEVWDIAKGLQLSSLTPSTGKAWTVAVTRDGRRVLASGMTPDIHVFDLESGAEIGVLRAHTGLVQALAPTDDGRLLVSASRDRTVRVWDLRRLALVATFTGDAPFYACAASSDGSTIVAGDVLGEVHFLRFQPERPAETPAGAPAARPPC